MKESKLNQYLEPRLNAAIAMIEAVDWTHRENYANWLAQNYWYVCHSTRLLAAAASRFQIDRDKFHTQQANHIREEKHHERLAVADLKALGFTPADFPELGGTKALYRSAYYLIERQHPLTLYGYVYFLEWLPIRRGKEIIEIVQRHHGPKCATFLEVHANEDPGHVAGYAHMIDALPPEDRRHVEEGLDTVAQNYLYMMTQVLEIAARGTKKDAA